MRGKKQNALTLIENLLAIAIASIVIVAAMLVASQLLREKKVSQYRATKWTLYRDFESSISTELSRAVYFSESDIVGAAAKGPFGIESWPTDNPSQDHLIVYSYLTELSQAVLILVEAENCSQESCQITLELSEGTNLSTKQLSRFDHFALSTQGRVALTEIQSRDLSNPTRPQYTVKGVTPYFQKPGLLSSEALALPLQANIYFVDQARGNSFNLRQIQGLSKNRFVQLSPQQRRESSRLVMPDIESFQVYYGLEPKLTAERLTDPCKPSNLSRSGADHRFDEEQWGEAYANCNFNNLSYVKLQLQWDKRTPTDRTAREESLSFLTKQTPILKVTPRDFDVAQMGKTDSLDLEGPANNCADADELEHLRCQESCSGSYNNDDWEPGSPYCQCKGEDNFSWVQIRKDDDRWSACCIYRNKLQHKSGASKTVCFDPCTSQSRSDNPWLVACNPSSCSVGNMLQSCIFPGIKNDEGMQNICNPKGGPSPHLENSVLQSTANGICGNEVSGPIQCNVQVPRHYPDVTQNPAGRGSLISVTSIESPEPSDPLYDYPQTDLRGKIQDDRPGYEDFQGKYLTLFGSDICDCSRQLYAPSQLNSGASARKISAPADYKYSDLEESFPDDSSTFTYKNISDASIHFPGTEVLTSYKPHSPGEHPAICYDDIWADSSNTCHLEFQATRRLGNALLDRPGPLRHFLAGNSTVPSSRNQNNWAGMQACACELAGYPHDESLSTSAEFRGYVPAVENNWRGRCSCYNPARASISSVNQNLAEFSGMSAAEIEASIRAQCGGANPEQEGGEVVATGFP